MNSATGSLRFNPLRHGAAILIAVFSPAILASSDSGDSGARLIGFSAENSRRQQDLERKFDAGLNPADQRGWMERMSSEPNHVGTAKDKANAEFMLAQFREWGWDAHIETFYCLYPTPLRHALELVSPDHFAARLTEAPVPGDRTSALVEKELPAYNIYGADGEVTADLVYVNFGMPDDYEELAHRGVSVKGRIAIARYGSGWRGLKPKLAYEHGAVGCIIYSDPHEDGYFQGDTYPGGPWRPPQGIQRGSVMDMPVYPGDPLTPNIGATKNAKRLSLAEAKTLLKIMVMPISYADARHLLGALRGPVAPESWRGALPITYHLGPGPAKVHMQIASDWSLKPVYDVIAILRGSEFPDEWVVRGNHHDGWVCGACDPLAGNVTLMDEAKAIGALAKSGWRPRRTMVYCGWDGEEPGLLGSTEWAEEHAAELQRKAVLYVNSDGNGRGWLRVGGTQAMEHFVNQVIDAIPDPEIGASVGERRRAVALVEAYKTGRKNAPPMVGDLPIDPLGGGTDFTVFLQHLGIASLDMQFGGEYEALGIYHSAYDSFDNYVRFGDPGFVYGVAQSKTIGHMTLRAAEADVLPMRFGEFAQAVASYLDEVRRLVDQMRTKTEALDRLINSNAFRLAADPTENTLPPPAKPEVPYLDFAPLDNALTKLKHCAAAYDRAYARIEAGDLHLTGGQSTRLNHLLQGLEQTLLDPEGLPRRPWYRHLIYSPGLYTGYGVKTLPGVREAVEGRNWDEANRYIIHTATALGAFCERLDEARKELEGP